MSRTQEAEAGGQPQVQGQPGLLSESQASPDYRVRSYNKNLKTDKEKEQ